MKGTDAIALQQDAMKKLFVAIAGRNGISVKFERECKQPQAKKNMNIILPIPSAIDAGRFWFYSFHELSHLLPELDWSYNEIVDYLNFEDIVVRSLANIIMDNLCERNLFGMYEGVDNIFDIERAEHTKEDLLSVTSDSSGVAKIKKNPIQELFAATMLEDMDERKDWMGYHMDSLPYDPDIFILQEAVRNVKYAERVALLLYCDNPARECANLVKDLCKLIGHEPLPPEGGSGKGKDGEGDCKECGGTGEGKEGKGKCEACDGTGKEKGKGDEKSDSDKAMAKLRQASDEAPSPIGNPQLKWEHNPSDYSKSEMEKVIADIDKKKTEKLDKPVEKHESMYSWDCDAEYIPVGNEVIKEVYKSGGNVCKYLKETITTALGTSTVSKRVSKFLKVLTTDSYTYGQKRGKLHQKNIHRVVSGKPNPGQSPSIFKKKNATKIESNSAVVLLLDCSGSMSGSKYAIGAACCVAISETLSDLQIPHEVLGFTDTGKIINYVFKPFHSKINKEKLLDIMSKDEIRMSSNADGEHVTWAAERLLTRTEKKKLLIVLSDGQPAGSFVGDGNKYLRKICKMIEDESPIDLVGIGIATSVVERFYKNYVVVNNPKELDSVLFDVLKKFLIKQ